MFSRVDFEKSGDETARSAGFDLSLEGFSRRFLPLDVRILMASRGWIKKLEGGFSLGEETKGMKVADLVARAASLLVRRSSMRQAASGALASGGGKVVEYLADKIGKGWRGR